MTTRLGWFFLAAMLLTPLARGAVIVPHLYSVDRQVPDQSSKQRNDALRSAMIEVLVRLSGNRNIAIQPAVAQALGRVRRYVQRYRYARMPLPADAPAGARPGYRLHIVFDGRALERLLQRAGQPVWGRRRPATLVWAAVEEGGRRYLLGTGGNAALRKLLMEQAHRRGIPLLFPLMDLEDQRRLDFATVWGGFIDEVARASARYPAEAVLLLRIRRDGQGRWHLRWLLKNLSQVSSWTTTGDRLDGALALGIDGLAGIIASRYIVHAASRHGSQVRLRVTGVGKAEDFARLSRYLASLTPVKSVDISEVDRDQVVFSLQIKGDMAGLVRSLALGSVIVPYAVTVQTGMVARQGSSADTQTANELRYRLQP